jgi:hypothetical protein
MEVEDLSGTHRVHSIAQLEQLLGVRFKDEENEFWLRAGKSDHPALSIMVKGDLAAVHYFPEEGHAGYVSIGGKMNLYPSEMTIFRIGSLDVGDTAYVPNESIVPFSDALGVAREFFLSQELPRSIEWLELWQRE